ncbi:hypothetical protein LCGC14_1689860 [marine sediment metagenome]|uniref:Uncharacterized protein n=1 Tax=marine sediment metagenome TaxID=412755 RepID=A0A0F9KLA6_9ZZZZ
MSERRKPDWILLARKKGQRKHFLVELFRADQWPHIWGQRGPGLEIFRRNPPCDLKARYRIRRDGKWWPKGDIYRVFTKTQIREIFFRGVR